MPGESVRVFRLYGTGACHLCELAHAMIEAVRRQRGDFTLEEIDISASEVLFHRYGERIPVLQHPNDSELCWPFSAGEVMDFLDA